MSQKQNILRIARREYNPALVAVNSSAIRALKLEPGSATLMASGLAPAWLDRPLEAIAYFIALNSINYRFWEKVEGEGEASLRRYVFEGDKGAMGMRRAFDKVWGGSVTPDNFRAEPITADWVTRHFGDIPDPESRAEILSSIFEGDTLERTAKAVYLRIVAERAVSADTAEMLHEAFPRAFSDAYMKRSQLAVSWIAGYFAEAGHPVKVTDLTVFADYQVPRTLRALGLIDYCAELADDVDSYHLLEEFSPEELAIRAATILACEELAEALGVTAAEVDNYLWLNRNLASATPFHLTETEEY